MMGSPAHTLSSPEGSPSAEPCASLRLRSATRDRRARAVATSAVRDGEARGRHQRQVLAALEALQQKVRRLDRARGEAVTERQLLEAQFDRLTREVQEGRGAAEERERRYERDANVVDATIRFERADLDRRLKEALAATATVNAARGAVRCELAALESAAAVAGERAKAADDAAAAAEADIARADATVGRRAELRANLEHERECPDLDSPTRVAQSLVARARALRRRTRSSSPKTVERRRTRAAAARLREERRPASAPRGRRKSPPPPPPKREGRSARKKWKKSPRSPSWNPLRDATPPPPPPPRRTPRKKRTPPRPYSGAPSALTDDLDYESPPPPPPPVDENFQAALAKALLAAKDPEVAHALAQVYAHAAGGASAAAPDRDALLETALDALHF